jgi:hypothetical protein
VTFEMPGAERLAHDVRRKRADKEAKIFIGISVKSIFQEYHRMVCRQRIQFSVSVGRWVFPSTVTVTVNSQRPTDTVLRFFDRGIFSLT